MPEEMVLGVSRHLLEKLGIGQGLHFNIEDYLRQLLDPSNSIFRPRAQVENDPDFKQLIPYVLIKRGNAWLHYVRGQDSGEKRLVSRGSIGIGGHINPVDGNLFEVGPAIYDAALQRELSEEIKMDGVFKTKAVALINDDSTSVGKMHLGIVHLCLLDNLNVTKRENCITNLQFLTAEQILACRNDLESWSQLCFDHLINN